METTDPSLAKQTLQILVKYLRLMKDLLKKIQKTPTPARNPEADDGSRRARITPGHTLWRNMQGGASPNLLGHCRTQPSRKGIDTT